MNLFTTISSSPTVLVLGAGKRAGNLYREIVETEASVQNAILGFVPLEARDKLIPERLLFSSDESLLQLARREKVSEIVVVTDHPTQQAPVQQLLDCKLCGIQLSDADSFLTRVYDGSYPRRHSTNALARIWGKLHRS